MILLSVLLTKLKEVLYAVLPITIIVLMLHFTIAPIDTVLILRFLIGTLLIILGLSIFLLGIDLAITPLGSTMGRAIAKSNKLWIVIIAGLALGFFISVAEPDLHILAGQVETVTSGLISKFSIVAIVSVGIAVMLAVGLIRIVFNYPLFKVLTMFYALIFVLSLFTSQEFLAISFDASGATTGALTVPFVLALALGVSALKKDSKASEKDSFGLVGIVSIGAIISVMAMSILSKTDKISGSLDSAIGTQNLLITPFIKTLPVVAGEILFAVLPILIIFLLFSMTSYRMSKRGFRRTIIGLIFTYIGFVLFLTGVNAGFMEVGSIVGYKIASLDNKAYIVVVGFVLGLVTILAEPAVYVLTHQIEDVTSGYVNRKVVMTSLCIGVGVAMALSIIRILLPQVKLWHYLLPGYLISILLTYFTPKLFVGIAFDSGGVASGPMTATFILAFAQGAAESIEGANVLVDGFGMIAMVALTPLIALQVLGLIYKFKSKKEV